MEQSLTFELMATRTPLPIKDDDIRLRMSTLNIIDPSIILKTDDTVLVSVDKNIYTIQSNLSIVTVELTVSETSTITLPTINLGIQEVLVNMDTEEDPAFGEIDDYAINEQILTLATNEYDNKTTIVKFLSTK